MKNRVKKINIINNSVFYFDKKNLFEILKLKDLEYIKDQNYNGKNMQKGNTGKMIFNINFLLSYLSKFMTLLPGDIITTGTPPGIGNAKKPPIFLKDGDEVKLSIDILGEQKQKIKQNK